VCVCLYIIYTCANTGFDQLTWRGDWAIVIKVSMRKVNFVTELASDKIIYNIYLREYRVPSVGIALCSHAMSS